LENNKRGCQFNQVYQNTLLKQAITKRRKSLNVWCHVHQVIILHNNNVEMLKKKAAKQTKESVWVTCIFTAIVFEGALRKWVIPAPLHPAAFLAKDTLGLCYIAFHRSATYSKYQNVLNIVGYSTAGLLVFSLLLGLGNSWQSAIITYKNAVLWPLIAASMVVNTNSETWRRLSLLTAPITIGMFLLGGEQFFSPASSWLNQYAWTAAGLQSPVATFGGIQGVRATGTFSYISGMSEFAVFSFVLCLYCFLNSVSLRQKVLLMSGCSAAIGCAVESGSRAPIVLITLVIFCGLTANLGNTKIVLYLSTFVLIVTAVVGFSLDKQMTVEYVQRWTVDPQETLRRFTNEGMRGNYWEMLTRNPIGVGLGQGNGYAVFETSRSNRVVGANVYDDSVSIAIYESGLLGLLAFYLAPCVLGWQLTLGFTNKSPVMRALAVSFGLVSVVGLIAGVWHDHNGAAFTWLQIGIWFHFANKVSVEQHRRLNRC
jgi:hypothetical protein